MTWFKNLTSPLGNLGLFVLLLSGCERDEIVPPPPWQHGEYEIEFNQSDGESKLIHTHPKSGKRTDAVEDFKIEKLGANDSFIKIAASDLNSIFYFYIRIEPDKPDVLSSGLTGDDLRGAEKKLGLPAFTWPP